MCESANFLKPQIFNLNRRFIHANIYGRTFIWNQQVLGGFHAPQSAWVRWMLIKRWVFVSHQLQTRDRHVGCPCTTGWNCSQPGRRWSSLYIDHVHPTETKLSNPFASPDVRETFPSTGLVLGWMGLTSFPDFIPSICYALTVLYLSRCRSCSLITAFRPDTMEIDILFHYCNC